MSDATLTGMRVLVTRPLHQADPLVAAIEHRGGTAVLFPTLQIAPRSAADVRADAAKLDDPDIAIFVSPNAVHHGSHQAGAAAIGAIGPATAAALEARGKSVDIVGVPPP